MVSIVNHNIRKQFNISTSQYLVLDAIYQAYEIDEKMIAPAIGFSGTHVEEVVKNLEEREFIMKVDDSWMIRDDVRLEMSGLKEVKPRIKKEKKASGIAEEIIELFNSINGTRYEAKTYSQQIDAICRAHKELNFEHFSSVIKHKAATWGKDEKMHEYNRPQTIFRSVLKFMGYLDDARRYWTDMVKQSTDYSEIAR